MLIAIVVLMKKELIFICLSEMNTLCFEKSKHNKTFSYENFLIILKFKDTDVNVNPNVCLVTIINYLNCLTRT